ncbi:HET-domain-containing protein, partial [Melanomma pulvis-pyrius CBS 109.77]
LPRRVLDVDTNLIKLVETEKSETGYYVALSHCWGKPENHPPKTTRTNYKDHLAGIPLAMLPKTFQDAVKITRHIGVQYLWIDSLCIVQDDESDWNREAANMGAIYEYARLTIAAAGAPDCKRGCFLSSDQRTYPPDPSRVTVLSQGSNGLPVTVHFAAVPWEEYTPYFSELGCRAWARQEWYLSRRLLLFTRGGISWKCRVSQFNEREVYYDMEEKREWEHLLQRYSEDDLTYETDRLVALQGVANQVSPIMDGTYHFGLWTHMPELLFWMMRGPETDVKGPDAPSWSWA